MSGVDFDIVLGTSHSWWVRWETRDELGVDTPTDLTGATARCQLRSAGGDLLVDMSAASGGCVIADPAAGTILMTLVPADTEGKSWRDAVWALEVTLPDSSVHELARGRVRFLSEIVR